MDVAAHVVEFWKEAGPAKWFARDDAFDAQFRQLFLDEHFAAASRARTCVTSSSGREAEIASAAISSGSSSWFVTCAWLLGVRRARILAIAICISTGVSSAMTALR